MKNNKGQFGIIVFFLILFTVLIVGFIAAMAIGIIGYASDELTPILKEVGVSTGDANIEQGMNITADTTSSIVGGLPWLVGFCYVLALFFSIAFIMIYKENPHPAFMGLYIILVFLLVLGSMVMSNMYQDIYTGNDVIATELQQNTLMTYMILWSPWILALIAFVGGVIMFSNSNEGGIGL